MTHAHPVAWQDRRDPGDTRDVLIAAERPEPFGLSRIPSGTSFPMPPARPARPSRA